MEQRVAFLLQTSRHGVAHEDDELWRGDLKVVAQRGRERRIFQTRRVVTESHTFFLRKKNETNRK